MNSIFNRLLITRIKIFFGRFLYRLVHLIYRQDRRIIVRNKIRYEVDLSEGMDLSMFLFSSFQKHISQNKYVTLQPDAVIFDIGANSGMMSLQFAKKAPMGKVYAFEPTFYAFEKLRKNLQLNPELAVRIEAVQSFVSEKTSEQANIKAYSSWRVDKVADPHTHPVHEGILRSAEGIRVVSVDDFCEQRKITKVDFIKIDTDGHEYAILKGAMDTIRKFRPAVIFEAGLYLWNEFGIDFGDYRQLFEPVDYNLYDSANFRRIDEKNYRKLIPSRGTIDILAIPKETAVG